MEEYNHKYYISKDIQDPKKISQCVSGCIFKTKSQSRYIWNQFFGIIVNIKCKQIIKR